MRYQHCEPGMRKYLPLLNLSHSWEGINCFTLVDKVYEDFLNISLSDTWKRAEILKYSKEITAQWYKKYNKEKLDQETKYWVKIPLTELLEFDILVFTSSKDIPTHFGIYIEQNMFIHVLENTNVSLHLLDDECREKIYGAYRHPKLV